MVCLCDTGKGSLAAGTWMGSRTRPPMATGAQHPGWRRMVQEKEKALTGPGSRSVAVAQQEDEEEGGRKEGQTAPLPRAPQKAPPGVLMGPKHG